MSRIKVKYPLKLFDSHRPSVIDTSWSIFSRRQYKRPKARCITGLRGYLGPPKAAYSLEGHAVYVEGLSLGLSPGGLYPALVRSTELSCSTKRFPP